MSFGRHWSSWKSRSLRDGAQLLAVRLVGMALSFASSLYLTRVVSTRFGLDQYGYVALLATLPTLLPFAALGVMAPLVNAFSRVDEDGWDLALATTRAAMYAIVRVGSLLVAGSCMISIMGWWPGLLGIPSLARINLVTSTIVAMFAASLVGGIGTAGLVGLNRLTQSFACQMVQPLIVLFGVVVVGQLNVAVTTFAALPAIGQAASAWVSIAALARCTDARLFRELLIGAAKRGPDSPRIGRESAAMTSIQAFRALGQQSDRIVLTHRSGADSLGAYSVAAQFYQASLTLLSSLALGLWPRFANRRRDPDAHRELLFLSLVYSILGAFVGAVLVVVGPHLYRTISGAPSPGLKIFISFALLLTVTTALQPISMYLTDADGLAIQARYTALAQTLNLALSWSLAPSTGAVGVVIASTVCLSLTVLPLTKHTRITTRQLRAEMVTTSAN